MGGAKGSGDEKCDYEARWIDTYVPSETLWMVWYYVRECFCGARDKSC